MAEAPPAAERTGDFEEEPRLTAANSAGQFGPTVRKCGTIGGPGQGRGSFGRGGG